MKRAIQRAATSLVLIVIVAMGARVGFAWDQARKIPPGVLGIVPFQQETGNIAHALAERKGFSDVFRTETGTHGLACPGLSANCCGDVQGVWGFYYEGFFCLRCAQHTFFGGSLCADFLCGETHLGIRSGERGGVALGDFSYRGDDAVRVDLGHLAFGAAVRDDFVGDFDPDGIGAGTGLVRIRIVVGFGADDESGAGSLAAVFVGMGGVARPRRESRAVETSRAGGRADYFVLCAVDSSQLHCVSSVDSPAVEFAV